VGTPNTPADEGPVAKKIKMEPDVKKEESDEDDEEFEDV
jgi:transcription initiation factor TFIIE subunit alpha